MTYSKEKESIYAQVGGVSSIKALVEHELYPRIQAFPDIANKLKKVEISDQVKMLTKLVCIAAGAPLKYDQKSIKKAHADLNINNQQYSKIASALTHAMVAMNWDEDQQIGIFNAIAPMRNEIVNRAQPVLT